MTAEEEIKGEILRITANYISKELSIRDRSFHKLIADAFIGKQHEVLDSLLEPYHLEALGRMLMSSLSSLEDETPHRGPGNTACDAEQLNKFSNRSKISDACEEYFNQEEIKRDLDSNKNINCTNLFEKFTLQALPGTLLPDEKIKERPAGISSTIYRLDHEPINDREERVEDKIEEICEALAKNTVVLVQGDTGCGKSTKIPRLLLSKYSRIVCTQPRRLAAISVARKVAADMKCNLGGTVGYAVRFDDRSSKSTRLKFVTDGILLKELAFFKQENKQPRKNSRKRQRDNCSDDMLHSKEKRKTRNRGKAFYDLIIIDEAHERSVNIDFLMGYCKDLQGVKLLVLSATLDSEKFIRYFNCPFIEIRHKPHPIDYFYLKVATNNPLKRSVETALSVLQKYDTGDILVFLTGQEDIDYGHRFLMEKIDQEQVEVLRLYSTMPLEEQDRVFVHGKRKIILSTNIAETSITIDTIGFVVDSGKVKRMRRNEGTSVDILETVTIAKDQARQRAGRSGRTGPGKVYRIYTVEEFEGMDESQVPEILRADISDVILSLKSLGINDVVNFDFIDKPLIGSIKYSICFLYYLGALDRNGEITRLGLRLSTMPLRPELSMALLTAKKLGCLDAVSTIAAFLNLSSSIYSTAIDSGEAVRNAKRKFAHPKGEFYSFLIIYNEWQKSKFSSRFIVKYGMNGRAMKQMLSVKLQLLNCSVNRKSREIREKACSLGCIDLSNLRNDVIEKSFASGYFMNVAQRVDGGYITVFSKTECNIHPSDSLYKKNCRLVLFHEIVCVRKEYMRTCLEIDEAALYEACNGMKNT
ncbi:hypothetical protein PAEPH01_0845 [Pancytospora epiphaga]|nr:hypothetical protein PAEPH01_0845 [Pancytospora epiphaga]